MLCVCVAVFKQQLYGKLSATKNSFLSRASASIVAAALASADSPALLGSGPTSVVNSPMGKRPYHGLMT